jgi:hypothetical protein
MSEKALRRLVAIVAALAVVYGLVRLIGYFTRPSGTPGGELTQALDRLRRDTLVAASITSPRGEKIEVKRDSTGWTVNGFKADSEAVDRLLRAAAEGRVLDQIARTRDNHSRLGVTQDSAWSVELRGLRSSVRALLGNSGREYSTAYMRLPDQDAVYEVGGNWRWALTRSLAEWRDKTVVRIDTARVQRVIVERDRERYELSRDSKGWKAGTQGVDSLRVRDLLSELARFEASGFAPDTARFEGKERRRIVALGEKGDTLARIDFAGEGSGTWLARTRSKDDLFQVFAYRVDRVTPKRSEAVPKR